MRKTYLAAILLLVSAGWAQPGSINGRVTDAQSGAPLLGANVLVVSPQLNTPTGAATDGAGRYTIAGLPAGTYTVTVTYIGYQPKERVVDLAAGQSLELDAALNPRAIQMQTYVVTASRRRERIEDAPAAITVITKKAIRRESNTNLGDYLKAVKGVDFTQSGVDSYNLSARGFNTSFSSRLLTLTDGRMANVPSLRLIAYNVIPVSFEDVEQFEVVLGPSSALYGPNAHSGVVNIITRSPRTSKGTSFNIQSGSNQIRKLAVRHASALGPFGFKVSGVAFTAEDWFHINANEYEGHDPAFLGRPQFIHDGVDFGGTAPEAYSPVFTAEMISGEIPGNGIDDNGNGWIDEDQSWIGRAFADGFTNPGFRKEGESNSPTITADMIVGEIDGNGIDDNGNGLIDEDESDIGQAYADGIDNNGDGYIDEGIDFGMDDDTERWLDGIDNDGDGVIDEDDEIGDRWLKRFGSYSDNGFGDYIYDQDGNLLFDTNNDGTYGGEGDIFLDLGSLPRWVQDANDDGINDFPVFEVRNMRYDLRADFDPNPDFHASFSHGYAWARNINITGIARFLADGWTYRYYQGRLRYKDLFLQAYLNTSFSGSASNPTRNLATGGAIFDRSRMVSGQLQHALASRNARLRFVWGLDYFLTVPDTRGTILADNWLVDRRDNNGNGEAGSPISFIDRNDNRLYDLGEGYGIWATDDGKKGGIPAAVDTVFGAIADGVDNDGDGLVDEGIDETAEDNRYVVNELGIYYQLNWKLGDRLELIQATRFDAHDRLTDLVAFNNNSYNYSPLNWRFNLDQTDGLQVSPKVGLVFKPAERQNLRITWAQAYNTPSNQALFLDLFVTRASIFRVYARGASGGYTFPRCENGSIHYLDVKNFQYTCMDTSRHLAFYLSADPRVEGYFKELVPDLPEIGPEIVNTLEVGYKGQLRPSLFGTLDIFRSHYNSFVSAITFITPAIVNRELLTTDYDGDGVVNTDPGNIQDEEDLEEARRRWTNENYLVGIAALDTTAGFTTPIVVGYANYGETDMWGLDMSLTWFINRSMSLDLNYSFLSISEFLNPITGATDPINAPRHKGGLKLQYNPPGDRASLALSYRYVDSFFWASGIYFGEIKAYSIMDFHGSYRFNDHLAAMMSITNLLNNRHVEIIGGPRLGRGAIIRLQASL